MADTKKTSLYINEDLLKLLKLKALEEDRKVNEIIIDLIEKYVK